MNILVVTAQLFTPQMTGGLQSSGNTLITQMIKRGHNVSLLCALSGKGWLSLRGRVIMKLCGRKIAADHVLGYTAWRAWFPWEFVPFVAKRIKPDVVVVLARQPVRMALQAQALGIPVLMMLQDVEFHDHGGDFSQLGTVACVANSKFTADRYEQAFGVKPKVIHPMVDAAKYKTASTREAVTFINPHPKKGLDVALAVAAALSEIPFSFVEAWPLDDDERAALLQKLRALPNVTLHAPISDMRNVYGKCRILLAPSKWEEAFGRVAVEAQISGIPVVASNRGGLPESVGSGGVLLDPDGPMEPWIDAVRQLWHDRDHYARLSAEATAHAHSLDFNVLNQIDAWEAAIKEAAGLA